MKKLLIFSLILAFSIPLLTFVHAQTGCKSDNDGVCLLEPGITGQEKVGNLAQYLTDLFPKAIGFIGLLGILIIIWEGVKYAASGVPGVKGGSKERITQALWGLLLALAAYILLRQINPELVRVNFSLESNQPVNQQEDQ